MTVKDILELLEQGVITEDTEIKVPHETTGRFVSPNLCNFRPKEITLCHTDMGRFCPLDTLMKRGRK